MVGAFGKARNLSDQEAKTAQASRLAQLASLQAGGRIKSNWSPESCRIYMVSLFTSRIDTALEMPGHVRFGMALRATEGGLKKKNPSGGHREHRWPKSTRGILCHSA